MSADIDPFDELAALFLTEPDTPGCGVGVAGGGLVTELVVVGHLPVRAGLWLTPYVDAIARRSGPAALVRLDGTGATLEVLRASEAGLPIQPPADLHQAVSSIAGQIATCVVRCPEPLDAAEVVRSGANRITVLSSADEAAVVAAYGIVKDLVESAEHENRSLPALGLAVIGSSDQQAARMVDRLNRTTATFLGVRVPLVACLNRMDASVRTTRFWRFGDVGDMLPSSLIALLRRAHAAASPWPAHQHETWRRQDGSEMPTHVAESPTSSGMSARPEPPVIHVEIPSRLDLPDAPGPDRPQAPSQRPEECTVTDGMRETIETSPQSHDEEGHRSGPHQPRLRPPASAPSRYVQTGRTPSRVAGHPSDIVNFTAFGTAASAGVQTVKMPPKPARQLEAKRRGSDAEPHVQGQPLLLSSYVEGLTALERIRCPGHERVELAIDAHGGVHLLTREASLRDLWSVESWFRAHLEIVAMACPQHAIDACRKVQLHLFTDQPATVADLHDSHLRLYVLAPVHVGEQVGWYFAALK